MSTATPIARHDDVGWVVSRDGFDPGRMGHRETVFTIGNGKAGPVAQRLRSLLVDIQRGNSNDAHGWFQKIF